MRFWRVLILASALGAGRAAVWGDTLTYTLTPQVETGAIKVELEWQTKDRGISAAGVSPRWGTIGDVPGLIDDLTIDGGDTVKREGARWVIEHKKNAVLTFRYEVRTKRKRFTWDSTHHPITTGKFFHGMGNAFLIVPEAGGSVPREYETLLRWKLPEGWQAICSWGQGRSIGATVAATDLRHSVYLAGEIVTKSKVQDGHSITVALVNRFGFSPEEFLNMAASIVSRQCEYMGEQNFPAFVVTAVPVGEALKEGDSRLSGVGLYNSFALLVAPESKLNDAVEHLFSHELFHYWNGRMLPAAKPDELVFWFVEGFTDYYAIRILQKTGYWSNTLFLKWLNRHIREYVANPAIRATNDDIKQGFWTKRDTVGEVAYQRGLMLALRWDKLARDHGVKEGVDKLTKALIECGRKGDFELSNDGIRRVGNEVLGSWFGADFDRHVMRAEVVEAPPDALLPEFSGRVAKVHDYVLGFDRERSIKQKQIVGLIAGSTAQQAGLREGDVLAGWNLYAEVDRKSDVTVMRNGAPKKFAWYPIGEGRDVLQFRPADEKSGNSSGAGKKP